MLTGSSQQRFNYIDALRGYAILGVIAVHVGQKITDLPIILKEISDSGQTGVQLFFVVSALTLIFSWHSRNDGAARFYIRRLFRVAPMFWLAACMYLLVFSLPTRLSTLKIISVFLFVHGWSPSTINALVPGGWSISAEVMFYVIFPFLVGNIRSFSVAVIAFFVAVAISILGNHIASMLLPSGQIYYYSNTAFLSWWFIAQAPVFLVGFLVYYAMQIDLPRWVWSLGIQVSILALLFLALVTWLPGPRQVHFALVFGLLTLSLAKCSEDSLINPIIEHIGRVSYSAYFWHFPVLAINDYIIPFTHSATAHFLALYASVILISIALSTVTYFTIEKPMIRMGSRLASRMFLQINPA